MLFQDDPPEFLICGFDGNQRWFVWIRIIFLGFLILACLTAIIQGIFAQSTVFLYILCAYSSFPPILAFFHVLLSPWLDLFYFEKPRIYPESAGSTKETEVPTPEPEISDVQTSRPPTEILHPWDPSRITQQKMWIEFI
jgi:hypothetical protein